MLASVVLLLRPVRPVELPPFLGRATHALFLDLVRRVDPALAEALHDSGEARPFATTPLFGGDGGGVVTCRPEEQYAVRLASLAPALTRALLERVLPSLPATVELVRHPFQVVGVATRAVEHPWSGQASYEDLVREHLHRPGAPAASTRLRFETPTTFRREGVNVPFPLPELVFGSLLDRWNAFAPLRLPDALRDQVTRGVGVCAHRTEARLVEVAGGRQVGFVGRCTYVPLAPDQYWWRQVTLLAAYAFYAGVGAKTGMGLGCVRPSLRWARTGQGGDGRVPTGTAPSREMAPRGAPEDPRREVTSEAGA